MAIHPCTEKPNARQKLWAHLYSLREPQFRLVISAAAQHGDCLPQSLRSRLVSLYKPASLIPEVPAQEPIPIFRVDLLVNGFSWFDQKLLPWWPDRTKAHFHCEWFILYALPLIALSCWWSLTREPDTAIFDLVAPWVVSLVLAAGLALNRRLFSFYLLLHPSGESLPGIASSNLESRNDPILCCRQPNSYPNEQLIKLNNTLILYDVDLHKWRMESDVPLHQVWKDRIHCEKIDRYKLTQETENWLWSLARLSFRRLLIDPPQPDNHEVIDSAKGKESFLLPFKLQLTQLKLYFFLIALVFLFGIYDHYHEHTERKKSETAITLTSQSNISASLRGQALKDRTSKEQAAQPLPAPVERKNSYTFVADETIQGSQKTTGNLAIPIEAFTKAVLLHAWPMTLSGAGVLWLISFLYTRPRQLDYMKNWYDRTIGEPPNKGQLFLLRPDLPQDRQWEEIIEKDFYESIEEFGPNDEKILHLAKGVLLLLLFELIHFAH